MIVCLSLLAVLPVIKVQLRCDRSYKTSTKPHKTSTNPPKPVIFQDFNVDVGQGGVEHFAQACGADMQPSVESLVRLLESHRGRDKLIRTVCFGSQLVGGLLSRRGQADAPWQKVGNSLLLFSAQLSRCRTTLRLFDDLPMLAHSHSYGWGGGERDAAVRWLSVLNNLADQLYYPCEHLAWAADAQLIRLESDRWWLFSTVLWGASLLLGILRSLRVLMLLKKKVKERERAGGGGGSHAQLRRQMRAEVLSSLRSTADLGNAIHWMPPGFLWAGRFPSWLVGLMGTISSLIALIQMCHADQAGDP